MLRLASALASLAITDTAALAQAHGDSAVVAAAVERYHRALSQGDSAAALALLSPDAVIVESGMIESLREYRSHHLSADIAFARTVKATRSPVHASVEGDVAWTTATTTARGTYRSKPINSVGAELMVLTRTAGGWTIRAIHWSSR
jgi:ketosteroid isomerase-like protein